MVQVTLLRRTRLLPNLNALVVASMGMHAVKLCSTRILQFFTWWCWLTQIDMYNSHKTVLVVVAVAVVVVAAATTTAAAEAA